MASFASILRKKPKHFDWNLSGDESVLVTWDGCTLEWGEPQLFADALLLQGDSKTRLVAVVINGSNAVWALTDPPPAFSLREATRRLSSVVITGPITENPPHDDAVQTCVLVYLAPHGLNHQRLPLMTVLEKA